MTSFRTEHRNYDYGSLGEAIGGTNAADLEAARIGSERLLVALKRYAINNPDTISGAHILRSVGA